MQRLFIVDRDFFTRVDVAQSEEHYVAKDGADVGIRLAGMVNVMRPVAAATAIDAPDAVNIADAQLGAMGAALSFAIRDALARVFGNLTPARKRDCRKAAFAVDC